MTSYIGPFIINKSKSFLLTRDVNAQTTYEYSQKGTGPLGSTGVQATGFFATSHAKARNESHHPDIQFLLLGNAVYSGMLQSISRMVNYPLKSLRTFYGPHIGKDAFFISNILSRPKSRGAIRLASANPRDFPLIHANYFMEQQDIDALIAG